MRKKHTRKWENINFTNHSRKSTHHLIKLTRSLAVPRMFSCYYGTDSFLEKLVHSTHGVIAVLTVWSEMLKHQTEPLCRVFFNKTHFFQFYCDFLSSEISVVLHFSLSLSLLATETIAKIDLSDSTETATSATAGSHLQNHNMIRQHVPSENRQNSYNDVLWTRISLFDNITFVHSLKDSCGLKFNINTKQCNQWHLCF